MVAVGKSRERAAAGDCACPQLPAERSRIFFFPFCVAACVCYYSLSPLFLSCCFSFLSSPFSASFSLTLCLAAAALSLRKQHIDSEQSLRHAALHRTAARYRKVLAAAVSLPGGIFAGHLTSRSSLIAAAAAASHRRRSRGAAADALIAAASAAAQRTSLRAASPAIRQLLLTIPFVAAALELRCLLLHAAGAPVAAAAAGTGCRPEAAAAAGAAARLCVLHTEAPAAAAVLSGTLTHLTPHTAAAATGRGPQRGCPAAAAVRDTPLSTTSSALRSAAVAALRAAARSGSYTFTSNSGRYSSMLLTRRRRLLCFPAAARLLLRSLSDATAAAASYERVQEVCVSQPAGRGEIAARHSAASLCLPHSGCLRRWVCGGEKRGTGKLARRKVLFPFPRDGRSCFISFGHTPVHSSTPKGSTCAAVTHFRLAAAAAAAARALLKCKETHRGAAPSCRLQQPRRYCSRHWCCTSLYLNSTYAPSACQSRFRTLSSARPRSQPHHTPLLPRCARGSSFELSNWHYLTVPATYTGANRLSEDRRPGGCLLRCTGNVAGTASLLADTLASHLHSKYVAVSRLLRAGTTSGADYLGRQLRRSFVGVDRPRIFAECTKIVDIARQSIHRQLLVPVTWRFANTVHDVATRLTSLLKSSRVSALLAGETRSLWISAAMEAAAECAAAAAAFWGTCAASMLLQKNIGVSCAAKTCKLFGVATVFAASNAATGAASTLRYIVEALHSRREAGRAESTQLQLLSSGARQVHMCAADVQPLRDTAVDLLHKSVSASSKQQMSPTARLHSSIGVTGAEATAPAQELHHASPVLQQQQRDLLADSSLQQEVERRREQPDATTRGGAAENSLDRLHTPGADLNYGFLPSSLVEILRACGGSPEALHACVKEGILGCVVFWLLGGRFFRLSPSSLLAPGAYHQHHLSLRAGVDYASLEERRFIKKLGETFGCHTCGRRRGVEEWVADHQPPRSVVVKFSQTWFGWMYGSLRKAFGGTRYLPQRFYPQCKTCSSKQAAVVKHNATRTGKADLIITWGSVRAYHLTGGVLQFLRLLAGS